jgi:chemotaxis protein methyltransferase CheR
LTRDITPADLGRFRAGIADRLGLQFEDERLDWLSTVLQRRTSASRMRVSDYLSALERDPSRDELAALGRELTVPETYFFRNPEQFDALKQVVLPERFTARAVERRLRVLSLGCASGDEAYSLAIAIRDCVPDPLWEVDVTGVDINPSLVGQARRARFTAWALRQTAEADRQRWFRPEGREFVLDDRIRGAVRFEERNLNDDDPGFWQRATYDVVFCRNVMMYFSRTAAEALVGRIARALAPGGYLFIGHAETLRGLSTAFHLRHTHGTFYYQRRDREGTSARPGGHGWEHASAPTASLAFAAASADTWVDAIHRASQRVAALTEARRDVRSGGGSNATAMRAWDVGLALELLQKERFTEALEMVDALPADSSRDPDVLLLRAALLVHAGHLDDAESACRRLLEVDDLSAGAHYVLALCCEGAGDTDGASQHDRVATYLDPAFAMPRLHIGLAARRAGDMAAARRELGQALVLLQREDASRILLFGGGFGREALMGLCRTELQRCGEARGR